MIPAYLIKEYASSGKFESRDFRKNLEAKCLNSLSQNKGKSVLGSIPRHSGMDKKPCSLIVERKTTATNLGFSPYETERNLSRTAYKKTFGETPVQEIFDAETRGLDVRFYSNEIDITELPSIYKDTDSVRAQMREFGLGKVIDEVIPYGSIMAGDWQKNAP